MLRGPSRIALGSALLPLVLLLSSSPSRGDEPRQQPATVVRLRGEAQVMAPGQNRWRTPNERERLVPGTQIKTGADGELILRLSERNIVRVGENTTFRIQVAEVRRENAPGERVGPFQAQRNSYRYEMNLQEGTATSLLRGLGGNSQYQVRTPVAVAGVRGTVFSARVSHGAGNQGQGVGNTGPGNQGDGPNAGTAGNAGGDLSGGQGGGGAFNLQANFTVVEGNVEVDAAGPGPPQMVGEGFSCAVEGMVAPTPSGDLAPIVPEGAPAGGADGAPVVEGGPEAGPAEGGPTAVVTTTTTAEAGATGEQVTTVTTTVGPSTAIEETLINNTLSNPVIQTEIQLRLGTSSSGICE